MFSNNTLIDRLSNRFRKSEEEINDSIKYIFSRIAQFIVDGKVFYIYDLGYIYADKNSNVVFRNADIAFDVSLENIVGKYYGQKSYYEAVFETMRHIIDNAEIIYIEDFGTFYYKDGYINFECSDNLSYLVEEQNDKLNKITSTALTRRLSSRFKKSKFEVISLVNELFKNIILSIINDNVFYIYDIGYIFVNNCKLIFRSHDIAFDESIKDISNNERKIQVHETILESIRHIVDNGERVYIEYFGTFFYSDGHIKFEADEVLLYFVDKRFNIDKIIDNISKELDELYSNKNSLKNKEEKYKSIKEYKEQESQDINHFEKEFFENRNTQRVVNKISSINEVEKIDRKITDNKITRDRITIRKKKNTNPYPILIAAAFIVVIAFVVISFINYPNFNEGLTYNIDNKNLYNIVNEYFSYIDSKDLFSYKLASNMYYWDLSKELYNDVTYWPLIYAYNNQKYKVDAVIKKGSSISYKKLPESMISPKNNTNSIEDIKYFYNTLSKSFIILYPNFISAKKNGHALWSLKLSYYYDKNVFTTNAPLIPSGVYSNILAQNGRIVNLYSQISKYNKLNGSIISSFMAVVK